MNPFRNNVGTLNEILFENRNQNYGAYVIRKSYNNTVFKSLFITAASFILLFWGLSLLVNRKIELPSVIGTNTPPTVTVVFDGTKTKLPEKKKTPPPASNKPTAKNAIGTIIKDTTAKTVSTNLNSNLTSTGTNTLTNTTPFPGTGTLSVNIEPTNTLTTGSGGNVELAPDVLPSMPGLSKFLSDNLNYPYDARENRVSGKVAVNFIVDEEGRIIETKIIHSVGFGCDEEALRVIKLMPKWKPGMLQGKPVKVSFNQVITFQLN
jgi:periplasmic protein TonB